MTANDQTDVILHEALTLSRTPFTVNIPFVCQRCGKCCNMPFPNTRVLPAVADYLGISYDDTIKMVASEILEDGSFRLKEQCPFLEDQACTIYPVRPDDCRLYHGQLFHDKNFNPVCPARRRQEEMLHCMKRSYPFWHSRHGIIYIGHSGHFSFSSAAIPCIDDIKIEHLKDYCSPSKRKWNEIWRRFQIMNPTEEETRLFLILNPVSETHGGTET